MLPSQSGIQEGLSGTTNSRRLLEANGDLFTGCTSQGIGRPEPHTADVSLNPLQVGFGCASPLKHVYD